MPIGDNDVVAARVVQSHPLRSFRGYQVVCLLSIWAVACAVRVVTGKIGANASGIERTFLMHAGVNESAVPAALFAADEDDQLRALDLLATQGT